ncbi:transmembrane GTPase Marf isoform X2 [Folsomia candida]|uniref:transmembrane GTPase Marf isoform X2 n=1 Tax=Folsomia candida TaxID=158441 RepID=UPI000B8F01D1|nr:transmembrane GTPase Marf isoform X2 [Folsomia candida]
MSAYIRSFSMMDGQSSNQRRGAGDAPSLLAPKSSAFTDSDVSPLQIFVQAKKRINDIFQQIEGYIKETSDFVQDKVSEQNLISKEENVTVMEYLKKIYGIREVLKRDHMKVVFFGRTSNGKSTVINAMLREKILPSGIGHTTSCFLQVEGGEPAEEAYLIAEGSSERQNVQSVAQLAHALCKTKLTESSLVKIYWPKDKCPLLRDDVVFVDSPGIDVSPNLDEWIDKYCLDADVFVLVSNAESTLMLTEKNFFHKVSNQISKPNIFILNNRWDAAASEMDFMNEVRAQHMERASDFLVNELKVVTPNQVSERIFFISAKEVLQARQQELKGFALQSGAIAEGFSIRYMEFQDFERKFEEIISKSAVQTKFEQHSHRGQHIVSDTKDVMSHVLNASQTRRSERMTMRKELWDKLDFTDKQLQLLTHEMKDKIRQMVEDVECKVSKALSEEIRRIGVLVDEFPNQFHGDPMVLNVYKKELHSYCEKGLGQNLTARLNSALVMNMENSQKEMTERMSALIPGEKQALSLAFLQSNKREPFEVRYRLNCDNLCGDFREDISFKFSFGIKAILKRVMNRNQYGFLGGSGSCSNAVQGGPRGLPPLPNQSITPMTPTNGDGPNFFANPDDWAVASRFALAAVTSQGTMGGLLVAGFLLKTVGWRVIVVTGVVYGGLYMYERLTWTNKAKEREFKRQYVEHATQKLRLIVDLTSANCSHQVQQELSQTFARLCHLVDATTSEMEQEMKQLDQEISTLEELSGASKVLKNKANYLISQLNLFDKDYLADTS